MSVMCTVYRELSDAEKATIAKIKALGEELHALYHSLGGSREVSLAKTKLEESVMWGTKGVSAPPAEVKSAPKP